MNAVCRSLTIWVLAVLAQANVHAAPGTDEGRRALLLVIVHNYGAVPSDTLDEATRTVTRVYEPLGIIVRWADPVRPSEAASATNVDTQPAMTIHLRILRRDEHNQLFPGVLGIDAPTTTHELMAVGHVLYQAVGDHSTSALALAHVMAHLIAGMAVAPDGPPAATIIRGDRGEAARLARGDSPFTTEEAERIRAGAVLLSAPGRRQPVP